MTPDWTAVFRDNSPPKSKVSAKRTKFYETGSKNFPRSSRNSGASSMMDHYPAKDEARRSLVMTGESRTEWKQAL